MLSSMAPKERPTMRDVAALAQVSLKTVSRVVNGEPTVAAELADRVAKAAAQLDYRPNLAASNLRRSDRLTHAFGVLLEDVSNPFSAAVHGGIEEITRDRNIAVLTGSIEEDPERERELVATLVGRRVDGLIIVPAGGDQSYLQVEQRAGLQIVFVDRRPRNLNADAVVSTNKAGARHAVAHLRSFGHERIAFLGDLRTIETANERLDGFLEAMSDLPTNGTNVESSFGSLVHLDLHTADAAESAVITMMKSPGAPSAIFAGQNLLTVGAIRALHQLGLQHSVALVGFDDLPLAELLNPGITVVAQDPARIGRIAAERLLARIEGNTDDGQIFEVETELRVRGSGEIRPTDL